MEMRTRPFPVPALWPIMVIGGSFLIGGLAGGLCGAFVSGESAGQLGLYLRDYMALACAGAVGGSALSSVWHHGRWLLACALLGFMGRVVIAAALLFALRGFFLSFGVSCFFRFFGPAGLLPAVCLFLVPALLWGPAMFHVGCIQLRRRSGALPQQGEGRLPALGAVVTLMLFFLCVLYEWGALPVLLPLAARILE